MNDTFMKEKPVGPLLASMALPMVFSMLVNSLYNIVDSFFVAQISEQAMTALSLVYPVQNMINAVAIGFGIGINARVSYHLGAGDKKMADTAATHGFFLTPVLMEAVTCWAREGKYYEVVEKGLNPSTEFFGAFRANIPLEGDADTKFNMKLKDELESYDVIWLAGEAKSHCVANTLRQLFDYPEVVRRLVILEDCMSNISGCEDLAIPIYEKAARMGARFETSESLLFA